MTAPPDPPALPPAYLRWPPPGLERIQGDLWRIIGESLIGGSILVLPLLWAVGEARPFSSAGPFGETWWIVLVTSVAGVGVLLSATVKLFRLLRRASLAADEGYGWRTVALVVADGKRENGFLLQGGRAYSMLDPGTRHKVAVARLGTVTAWFVAAAWHPVGFVTGLLLASRGLLSESGLIWLTTAPFFALLAIGYLLGVWERGVLAPARRGWHKKPWSRDLEREEIRRWREDLAGRDEEGARWDSSPSPRSGAVLRGASWLVILGALFVALPSLALVVSSSVSPVLAMVSTPSFGETMIRAARAEPLRRLRLPPDPAITPEMAGAAFHTIMGMDGGRGSDVERPPERSYPDFELREAARTVLRIDPGLWGISLYASWDSLSPEARAFVTTAVDHPALEEWSAMGRAASADIAEARWVTPFPPEMTATTLPIPRIGRLRDLAYLAAAKAVVERKAGRLVEAEETILEIVSGGLLLLDDGPTLIDNLVGAVIVGHAGDALAAFYRDTGRAEEADELAEAIEAAEATARMVRAGWPSDPYGTIRAMPALVLNPSALRGLRWEAFATLSSIAPCMNANRIVFGPDEAYGDWLGNTRNALVRFPSEDGLYDLMARGWFGAGGEGGAATPIGRLFTLTMGGEGPGSCARTFEAMGSGGLF